MGADIHIVLEKKYKGEWVGVHTFPSVRTTQFAGHASVPDDKMFGDYPRIQQRNYQFFAAVASVRGEGMEPRGFPDDASRLAQVELSPDDRDLHSHSWLLGSEMIEPFSKHHMSGEERAELTIDRLAGDRKVDPKYDVFNRYIFDGWVSEYSDPGLDDFRFVFAFDN